MPSRRVAPVVRLVGQVTGLALAALVILALTTLLVACVIGWWRDTAVLSLSSLLVGVVCSLATWLIVAAFHIHRETLVVPLQDRRIFVERLRLLMEGLGYEVTVPADDRLVGRPAFSSMLFGGTLQAELGDTAARILGPKVYLEMLRRRLRVEHHLEKLQQSFLDHKRREGEQLLRRVQVCLQVSESQWKDVYEKVIACLTREGAVVHCHVNILAQSEQGMRDSIIELGVADWLRKNDIKAEVHKEGLTAGKSATVRLPGTSDQPLGSASAAPASVRVVPEQVPSS
jgi:hypothetical protein